MKQLGQVIQQTIPSMTLLSKTICKGCKKEIEIVEMEIPFGPDKGRTIKGKRGCECRERQLDKEILETNAQARQRNLQKLFDRHSLINLKLQQATFDTYIPQNQSQERAKKIAERYVEIFSKDEPRNILFTGTYGTGKSHLAKSITDGIIKRKYSAIFISVPKLLTKFRASYSKDAEHSEADLINALNQVDVLVLDDLGAEKSSEWGWEKLFEIVDSRQGLHTVYTTNLSPKDLISKLGERNFSRVMNDDTTVVEVSGENFRLRKFTGKK